MAKGNAADHPQGGHKPPSDKKKPPGKGKEWEPKGTRKADQLADAKAKPWHPRDRAKDGATDGLASAADDAEAAPDSRPGSPVGKQALRAESFAAKRYDSKAKDGAARVLRGVPAHDAKDGGSKAKDGAAHFRPRGKAAGAAGDAAKAGAKEREYLKYPKDDKIPRSDSAKGKGGPRHEGKAVIVADRKRKLVVPLDSETLGGISEKIFSRLEREAKEEGELSGGV